MSVNYQRTVHILENMRSNAKLPHRRYRILKAFEFKQREFQKTMVIDTTRTGKNMCVLGVNLLTKESKVTFLEQGLHQYNHYLCLQELNVALERRGATPGNPDKNRFYDPTFPSYRLTDSVTFLCVRNLLAFHKRTTQRRRRRNQKRESEKLLKAPF